MPTSPNTVFSTALSSSETVFAQMILASSDIVMSDVHIIDIIADSDSRYNRKIFTFTSTTQGIGGVLEAGTLVSQNNSGSIATGRIVYKTYSSSTQMIVDTNSDSPPFVALSNDLTFSNTVGDLAQVKISAADFTVVSIASTQEQSSATAIGTAITAGEIWKDSAPTVGIAAIDVSSTGKTWKVYTDKAAPALTVTVALPYVLTATAIGTITQGVDATSSNKQVPITVNEFESLFYGKLNPATGAAFQLNGSGDDAIKFYQLNRKSVEVVDNIATSSDTVYSLMDANGNPNNKAVNLIKPVLEHWAKDTGHSTECWSTCSLMSISNEINATHNLQNLDCNISCSLCYSELLGLLDSIDSGNRTRVIVGDKVGIRILFTNTFAKTTDVEVRIHYIISA